MLSEKHREAEALEIFKKAETLDPTNPVVYDAIARSYARLERWDEAIKYLKKGIEKTPKEESFYKLVYAYYMCRDLTKEAKEYFSDLLNRNPKNKLAAKYLRLTQGFEIFRGSTQEKLKQEKR